MKEKTFCEECRKDVEYIVSDANMTGRINGKEYHYSGKETRCAECGAFVDVPEISDANIDALYEVYRKENDIVPLDVVRAIPKKYGIGKRPLSLLLGWGELTFSRYCDGNVPTKPYSNVLMRIYNEPKYYLEILEANKDKLKSKRTYEKTRKAVDALIDSEDKPGSTSESLKIIAKIEVFITRD